MINYSLLFSLLLPLCQWFATVSGYFHYDFLQLRWSTRVTASHISHIPLTTSIQVPSRSKQARFFKDSHVTLRCSENDELTLPSTNKIPNISYSDDRSAPYLQNLNEVQHSVVTANLKNIRVQAGPGSGKTRVLISRIVHLIKNKKVNPENILAVTFTKKAANEMRNRLEKILMDDNGDSEIVDEKTEIFNMNGFPPLRAETEKEETRKKLNKFRKVYGVTCTTFHSFCCKILREHSSGREIKFTVFDDDDSIKVIKRLLVERNKFPEFLPRAVWDALSTIKINRKSNVKYESDNELYQIACDLLSDYNLFLKLSNAKDFNDLILHTIDLILLDNDRSKRIKDQYKHILCDEWQDIDKSQYLLMRLIVGESNGNNDNDNNDNNENNIIENPQNIQNIHINEKNEKNVKTALKNEQDRTLFVVGDSSQTIYSWRGADSGNLMQFKNDFPDCLSFELSENYRSHEDIIKASRSILGASGNNISMDQEPDSEYFDQGGEEGEGEEGRGGVVVMQRPRPLDKGKPNERVQVMRTYMARDQADYVAHMVHYLKSTKKFQAKEIAIMYRNHAISQDMEVALISRKIKFKVIGGKAVTDRKEMKHALAYLRLLANPSDVEALSRVINYPPRGIGTVTQDLFFNSYVTAHTEKTKSRNVNTNIDTEKGEKDTEKGTEMNGEETGNDKLMRSVIWSKEDKDSTARLVTYSSQSENIQYKQNDRNDQRNDEQADPIVSLLIQLGDDAVINKVLSMKNKRKKDKDTVKKTKKSKEEKDENEEDLKQEIMALLTPIQLENVELILDILNSKQLKALQTASRVMLDLHTLVLKWEGGLVNLIKEILIRSGLIANIENTKSLAPEQKQEAIDRYDLFLTLAHDFDMASNPEDLGPDAQNGAQNRLIEYLDNLSLSLNSGEEEGKADPECVNLLTLHASKGLEFDCVFILSVEEGILPSTWNNKNVSIRDPVTKTNITLNNYSLIEEERRLLYVGMTRARKQLTLSYRKLVLDPDYKVRRISPSRFFDQLPANVQVHEYNSIREKTITKTAKPKATKTVKTVLPKALKIGENTDIAEKPKLKRKPPVRKPPVKKAGVEGGGVDVYDMPERGFREEDD